MENAIESPIERPDIRLAIWETIDRIGKSDSIETACGHIDDLVGKMQDRLLLIKVADLGGEGEAIRPWSAFPEGVRSVGKVLRETGGCIFHREACSRMRPFLLSEISRANYPSLMERRFLAELEKLDHGDILAVPIVLGRGMALILIGVGENPSPGRRQGIVDIIQHLVAAMLLRFPQVGRLFEQRRLSGLQSKVLRLKAEGMTGAQVKTETGISETTQRLLLEKAMERLGARNPYELVRVATLLGEIDR